MAPFSTLRFMDLMATNASPVVEWADRTRPESFFQTGPKGVAYESLIALANATHRMFVENVPAMASDDFVHRFGQTPGATRSTPTP